MNMKKLASRLAVKIKYARASLKKYKLQLLIKVTTDEKKIKQLADKLKTICERQRIYGLEEVYLNEFETRSSHNDYKKIVYNAYANAEGKSKDFVELDDSLNVQLSEDDVKLIAFYLPQFHSFKENDEWWGRGFTEWTNVTKAVPQFAGHHQPHLPIDQGFYNACSVDTQQRQVELAKKYGLYGFCFYHYWFSGKRLMEKPVDIFLENKDKLEFPFCLCWANENWSRTWDGKDNDILIAQEYLNNDEERFIKDIAKYITDSRYIRIKNKPLIMIYAPQKLPDAKATLQLWREECRRLGVGEIYIVAVKTSGCKEQYKFGVDAAVEFPPHNIECPSLNRSINVVNPNFKGSIWGISDYISRVAQVEMNMKTFRGCFPSWDNTARKPNTALIFADTSPESYNEWLSKCIKYTKRHMDKNEQFVFINAWNEWAEGAHLEPDRKYGYAFLQETANAIIDSRET